jgi:hypothetical protein
MWVITRSAADAEEAAQDGFVKAHAALPRFREATALPTTVASSTEQALVEPVVEGVAAPAAVKPSTVRASVVRDEAQRTTVEVQRSGE